MIASALLLRRFAEGVLLL
jgi:hypothetical protein